MYVSLIHSFLVLTINFSSGAYFDGFLWLVSMKLTTSLYLVIHRSSCVITFCHFSLWSYAGLIVSYVAILLRPSPQSSSASTSSSYFHPSTFTQTLNSLFSPISFSTPISSLVFILTSLMATFANFNLFSDSPTALFSSILINKVAP